jgi:serine/threonine protein kinase
MCKAVGFQGTPLYSAPETFEAVPQVWRDVRCAIIAVSLLTSCLQITRSCDIYSLGVVMWEALTGKVPWDGLSVADMKARVTLDFTYALSRLAFLICQFPSSDHYVRSCFLSF